jgi:hypothetical protein
MDFHSDWAARKYLSESLIEVDELVTVVDALIRHGGSLSVPSLTVAPRNTAPPA